MLARYYVHGIVTIFLSGYTATDFNAYSACCTAEQTAAGIV
jgi:hypothetical protein